MSTFTPDEFAVMHINDLERHKFVLTSDGKIAIRILGGSGGDMLKSENLAGLTDYAIARSNLEVYSSNEINALLTGYALTGHDHAGVYEPVFSKNTAFNKDFGTAAGTVLEGNNDALYEKLANKGQANGYAPLDSGSLIPSIYLPSYVDDVIDIALYASLPVTGESGKIYNVYGDTISLNGSYRWGGAAYSKLSSVSDAVWGHITGTLTDQADLVSAFAGKADLSHTHVLADLPAISQNHFLGRNSSGSGTIEVLSATQARSALSVYSQAEITSYLSSKANDSEVVHLTGDETIAGNKTWEGVQTLQKAGSIGSYFIRGDGAFWNARFQFQDLTTNNIFVIGQRRDFGGGLLFEQNTGSAIQTMILRDGKVGIRTTNPLYLLDIAAPAFGEPGTLRVRDNSGFSRGLLLSSPAEGIAFASIDVVNTNSSLKINTRDFVNQVFLNGSNGNVGIRTDNPLFGLHVLGDTQTRATLLIQNTNTTGEAQFRLQSDDYTFTFYHRKSDFVTGFYDSTRTWLRYIGGGHATLPATASITDSSAIQNVACAMLTVQSTTKGFLPPKMTTTQKTAIASPVSGLIVYDTTLNKMQCYNGSTWNNMF